MIYAKGRHGRLTIRNSTSTSLAGTVANNNSAASNPLGSVSMAPPFEVIVLLCGCAVRFLTAIFEDYKDIINRISCFIKWRLSV
ncbi:hypothetical protein KCP75_10155 [Salmonella enterica subsp. enterica]|nr:hypothetical protein KCP75_10155 [Salmonella enterica subsp. enterica]